MMTKTKHPDNDKVSPIYKALSGFQDIEAAFTGRGISPHNNHFSFRCPPISDPSNIRKDFTANLKHLAYKEGFDPGRLLWPKGGWPHTGQVIKAEDYTWATNARLGGLTPIAHENNQPVMYDGIATRSYKYVLGVQGADCPMIFLYDPTARVIGLVHAGWRPVVRGVVRNAVEAMNQLGATAKNIVAYITPGVGDRYNEFQWDDMMESGVKEVFVEAGRLDLLEDKRIRHDLTEEDQVRLTLALGREIHGGTSFKLTSLALTELTCCGLLADNISWRSDSTIVSRYSGAEGNEVVPFRYHSFRREFPRHGLSIGILFLKPELHESAGLSRDVYDSSDCCP
jgi:copper oxidase (laccase) domain-containing protein